MTVAFSSSSPITSIAIFDSEGSLLAKHSEEGRARSSGILLHSLERLLTECNSDLKDVELFLADLGPGSFTGVKVGVTICKTLAYAQGKQVAGASAFDLISVSKPNAIPSRKGEYFLRVPGKEAEIVTELPEGTIGYGSGFENPVYPLASGFEGLISNCKCVDPAMLVPEYIAEPSISKPRDPRLLGGPHA